MLDNRFNFSIKGPSSKVFVKIPLETDSNLAEIRQTIEKYLMSFYFYDEDKKKIIHKFYESDFIPKSDSDISVRFPSE